MSSLKFADNFNERLSVATNADIKACLGEAAAKYAANKHRGGSNGNKGTRYEDFFMAYKVVEAASRLLEDPDGADPHIKGQEVGFVDDVRVASAETTAYFQLKNKDAVSWTGGDHPIATDFEYQVVLSLHIKEQSPSTNLVVPTTELAAALSADIPSHIKGHTHVHHFPWTMTANRLVLECSELRGWLANLAHIETPTNDVLSGAFGAMLMACVEHPEGATARELVDRARSMYPGLLRLLPATEDWKQHLDPTFKQVLDEIDGLVYGAKRGFFYWLAFGTSGVFGSTVLSEEFKQFQNDIVQAKPTTFEEVLP